MTLLYQAKKKLSIEKILYFGEEEHLVVDLNAIVISEVKDGLLFSYVVDGFIDDS